MPVLPSDWTHYTSPYRFHQSLLAYVVLALPVRAALLWRMGIYQSYWVYADAKDLLRLIFAITAASVILAAIVLLWVLPSGLITSFPRSVLLIDYILYLGFIGGSRLVLRMWTAGRSGAWKTSQEPRTPILIAGAGDAGSMVIRELAHNPQTGLEVVGLVDDDPLKLGLRIRGYPVLGATSKFPNWPPNITSSRS